VKRYMLLLVAVLALAGGSAQARTSAPSVPFDRAFIDAMVPHHESAIAMAKEAKSAGLSAPALVKIANDILRSQSAEIRLMHSWRKAWYGSAAVDPHGSAALGLSAHDMGMAGMPGMLKNAKNVDKAFASMMVGHHKGAVVMAKLALQRGQHGQLRALARRIIAAQEREIAVMRRYA
jgi:uncharacterized protein (DUF305 family)